uniref:Uncharacterized protein n=1 Tax=Ignisphaera aggregans TaxID=334771 RepID=A0A7C2ZNE1_9CREN
MPEDQFQILLVVLAVVLLVLTMSLYFKWRSGFSKGQHEFNRYGEEVQRYITLIKCTSGDHTEERELQEGDFIGKVVGECPKCKNKLVIDTIYAQYAHKK